MVTNAELAKKVEELEANFDAKLNNLVSKLVIGVVCKLKEAGVDVGAIQTDIANMDESLSMINEITEKTLHGQRELLAANKNLKAENDALRKRVADLEQYTRLNNVEIRGIPTMQGEDCSAIVVSIGNQAKCPISASDLDIVHRVPAKSGQCNIIARFCSRAKKNEFVKMARKARLDTRSLGFSGENPTPVYVNEHLSPDNKRLFGKAVTFKKEKNWRFLWTENCQIKARQSEDSKVFRIMSESDLRIFA